MKDGRGCICGRRRNDRADGGNVSRDRADGCATTATSLRAIDPTSGRLRGHGRRPPTGGSANPFLGQPPPRKSLAHFPRPPPPSGRPARRASLQTPRNSSADSAVALAALASRLTFVPDRAQLLADFAVALGRPGAHAAQSLPCCASQTTPSSLATGVASRTPLTSSMVGYRHAPHLTQCPSRPFFQVSFTDASGARARRTPGRQRQRVRRRGSARPRGRRR